MKKNPKKDTRDKFWAVLEAKIQQRAPKKDKKFILAGEWKKFLRQQEEFKIFEVDGAWIRSNLSVIFNHGGHGYVFEFIPMNEIWIGTHHPKDCECKNLRKNRKMSKQYFESTIVHEIIEFKEMKKGIKFWEAHLTALKKELSLGLLKNPYREI